MLFKLNLALGLLLVSADAFHSAMLRGARSESYQTKAHVNGTIHTQNFITSETHTALSSTHSMPRLFVAIFAKRSSPIEERNAMRNLWREVDDGTGVVCAKFAMCKEQDEHQQRLIAESLKFGDFLFLPCSEGYARGLLTKKVIAVMRKFRQSDDPCLNRPLMMKIDDDTFVAGQRLRDGLANAAARFGTGFMFGGVPTKGKRPIRDPSSIWYEPYSTWSQDFPPAMYGGTGYVMGRKLVENILDHGVADLNILYNEDRAVGVWVYLEEKRGAVVNHVIMSGTNGFSWDHPVSSGTWGAYPYVFHHHLTASSINCLAMVDRRNKPNEPIDHCFH